MVLASYTNKRNLFIVVAVTDPTFVEEDYETVKDLITDTDMELYKQKMYQSVEQGLAYRVYKDNVLTGFVYNIIHNGKYYGASIKVVDIESTLIALKTMFDIVDYHKIEFLPHTHSLQMFKSMIRGTVIRTFHNRGRGTLSILRSDIVPLGERLFKYFQLEEL